MKSLMIAAALFLLLNYGSPATAQVFTAQSSFGYYDGYDYHYSSRISRFHRSYTAFSYYSPVFTDEYWYSYQPFSWGVSIYHGGNFGYGRSYNYAGYGFGNGFYDPYFGNTFWYGNAPAWFYPPVVVTVRSWNGGWYGINAWSNRNVYNSYYNYGTDASRTGFNPGYRRSSSTYQGSRSSGETTVSDRYTGSDRRDNSRPTGNAARGNNTGSNRGNRTWDDNNPNPNSGNRYGSSRRDNTNNNINNNTNNNINNNRERSTGGSTTVRPGGGSSSAPRRSTGQSSISSGTGQQNTGKASSTTAPARSRESRSTGTPSKTSTDKGNAPGSSSGKAAKPTGRR